MKQIINWIGISLLTLAIATLNSGCIRASIALGGDADREAPNQFFGAPQGNPAYYPSPYDSY